MTVVDGDTNARVPGARVTVGGRSARSDARGVARVPLARRSALVTRAAKPGYAPRATRLSFRSHPKSTIRIYRRSLQWAMYGADPARSQTQPALSVRPPFRVVWSRGLGTLIEFPAVVQDGVAYVANARGTVRALDMRNGEVIWRHDTPHGKMASSPAVWRDQLVVHGMDGHVRVLRRSDGRLLWQLHRRLSGRVLARDRRRRRRVRRVERHDHGARPAHPPGSLAPLRRLQGDLVGRLSPGRRSTSATTAAACSRFAPPPGRCASRGASAVASTARLPSRRAGCSCPARPGGR